MGYRIDELQRSIRPIRLYWLTRVGSTNTWAMQRRRLRKLFAPSIVLAGRQTAGRGSNGRTWLSPPGVMTATFVYPPVDSLDPHLLPLAAGIAVRDAIADATGVEPGLKWPNDLWIDDRKVAGLLCERIDGVDLIGVGINANLDPSDLPKGLRTQSCSLMMHASQSIDTTKLIIALATRLDEMLLKRTPTPAGLLTTYARHHVLTGRRVRVMSETIEGGALDGTCEGIDRLGRLLVRSQTQTHALVSGTVRPLTST